MQEWMRWLLSLHNDSLILPFDLQLYPNAKKYNRINNPFDQVQIPVSMPLKTSDGYVAAYRVPMEGKVTMLQFLHSKDDSPLLIRQYY